MKFGIRVSLNIVDTFQYALNRKTIMMLCRNVPAFLRASRMQLAYTSLNIVTYRPVARQHNNTADVFSMCSAPRLFARQLSGNTPLQQ
jgi:hypothetical protein